MTQGDNESSDDSVEMLESTWVAGLRCPCVNGPQASCSGKETLTSCGPAGPTSRPSSQPDGAAALPLQIWDTGGQERFRSMVSTFYKGSDGCILAFDVTDLESFEALDTWRGDVLAKTIPMEPSYPMVVLGNKIDLADRQVPSILSFGLQTLYEHLLRARPWGGSHTYRAEPSPILTSRISQSSSGYRHSKT